MAIVNNLAGKNIDAAVIAACVAVFLALTFSNLYLLHSASHIADDVHLAAEQDLVRRELDNQFQLHALDQSQISHWDEALEALEEKVDKDFVAKEIADWLWSDFEIRMTVVVDEADKARVTVYEKEILSPEDGQLAIDQNMDLVRAARQKYVDYLAKQTVPLEAFSGVHHPVRSENPIYVKALRQVNGAIATAVAQVLVPDANYPMPGPDARVLLTFKSVPDSMQKKMGEKLGLANFHIDIGEHRDQHGRFEPGSKALLGSIPGAGNVFAHWDHDAPSEAIWHKTLPALALPYLAAILALTLISIWFSAVVRKLQQSEQQNRFLALHDALTSLPNRLHFDQALEEIITKRKQDRCAILCLDLDRFKAVNDTFGHQAGDVVLKTIADRLICHVADNGMVARIGGDEFIILLHKGLDRDSVLFLCDQLIEDVKMPIDVPGGVAEVGASIGVAWWPDDALTVKSIIRSADDALYSSKERGRGVVSCAGRLRREGDGVTHPFSDNHIDRLRDEMAKAG